LFWLGSEWWGHRWGAPLWLVLVWMPWLSWLAVMALTGRIELWWGAIWLLYPGLLLSAALLWIGWKTTLCQTAVH
jgi:hypothetical protein